MEEAQRALIEDVRTESCPGAAHRADGRARPERADGVDAADPRRRRESQPAPIKPTKRGGGGALKTLWWRGTPAAAALRQRHRTRKARASSRALAVWDNDGNLAPIPPPRSECENGGVLEGGKVLGWRLKKGVTARRQAAHRRRCRVHLGIRPRPGPCVTSGVYRTHRHQGRRPHGPGLVRSRRRSGRAFRRRRGWSSRSTCSALMPALRATRRTISPVGTGPYTFVDFKPGDIVLGALNKNTTCRTGPISTPSR